MIRARAKTQLKEMKEENKGDRKRKGKKTKKHLNQNGKENVQEKKTKDERKPKVAKLSFIVTCLILNNKARCPEHHVRQTSVVVI